MSYDWRARLAAKIHSQSATNLGFVLIDEESIRAVKNGQLEYRFGLYWPRQVYGRLVSELAVQGAHTVAFDTIFAELREDHPSVLMANGETVESDEYFAQECRSAGNVLLAVPENLPPPSLFRTNAAGLGDIATEKDADGILRRVRAFRSFREWHPALRTLAANRKSGVDLYRAQFRPGQIVFPRLQGDEFIVDVDADNNFTLNPQGAGAVAQKAKAFTETRVWHMGLVLAARWLKLDLDHAEVDLARGRITLHGPAGLMRVIPVDQRGYFDIDWMIRPNDTNLTQEPVHSLLWQNRQRLRGQPVEPRADWKGKLVVVGSSAQGNDLTDRGATPLERDTLLASKHWNVANMLLTDRFIQRTPLGAEFALIALLGGFTALLTIQLRGVTALAAVGIAILVYGLIAVYCYVQFRVWVPLVLPVVGAIVVQHLCLVTYRVVFEERERRRVKSVFSRIVAPDVVNELLEAKYLAVEGARREVTVLFADIRGFTELTDVVQDQVAERVTNQRLTGAAAEACYDEMAVLTLETISLYLGLIADIVKKHGGTLDKYIGDCAMAFWGAPKPNARHAVLGVRAAIEAQQEISKLNALRTARNAELQIENAARISAGLVPKPLLPILSLGTGINSGAAMVGLMGSDAHGLNYTVLGREVNLASRLETISGRGRIIIGPTTHQMLLRDDAALAARCVEQELVRPKGFQKAIRNFEVLWHDSAGVA